MLEKVDPIDTFTYVVGGVAGPAGADAMHVTAGSCAVTRPGEFFALVEPRLQPGEFRGAHATAALSGFSIRSVPPPIGSPPAPLVALWAITDVDADWDDESGLVQLRYRAWYQGQSDNQLTEARLERITFQVVTFAATAAQV